MTIRHTFKKGEIVFHEGSSSDCAYIIESGKVEIVHTATDGSKKVLGILKADDIFGELGVIDGLPRTATARALEDSQITVITKEKFDALAEHDPELLRPLIKILSQRLRETLHMLKKGYKLPGTDRRQPLE